MAFSSDTEDDEESVGGECEYCGMVGGHEPDCVCRESYDVESDEADDE